MRYVRIHILADDGHLLFQKDFKPLDIFGSMVHSWVSALVREGVLVDGELYRAKIVPCYGNMLRPITLIEEMTDEPLPAPQDTAQPHSWLEIEIREPPRPETAVAYFTAQLYLLERSLRCTADFQIEQLQHTWQSIGRALVEVGLLSHGDQFSPEIFVRDDDTHDMFSNVMPPRESADAPLVELLPTETSHQPIERRSITDFAIAETRFVPRSGRVYVEPVGHEMIEVLIARPALEAMQAIARADVQVEQGGMLIGQVYQDATREAYLVTITNQIAAENTLASLVELRFTFESWQHQQAILRERFPGQRIVGWYHTHLVGVHVDPNLDPNQPPGESTATPIFFSEQDESTHRQFFPDPWYVAIVLGPSGEIGFFYRVRDRIALQLRYHVLDQADSD